MKTTQNNAKATIERRVFIATRGDNSVIVDYNVTENVPTMKFMQDTNELRTIGGRAGARNSAIRALLQIMKQTDVKTLKSPIFIYINKDAYEFISNGTYKFWSMTGVKSTGEIITDEEQELCEDIIKTFGEKGLYFEVRDIFQCSINEKVKKNANAMAKMKAFTLQNDAYASACWERLNKMVAESKQNSIAKIQVV